MTTRYNNFVKNSKAPEYTAQGFLKIPATLAKVGIYNYTREDGVPRRELIPHEEVFNTESMNSLSDCPVTLNHPPEKVNPKNVNFYQVGHVATNLKKRENKFIDGNTIVTSQNAIDEVTSDYGPVELSSGYTNDLIIEPGIYNGQHYDAIQRNIRYNHVAIVHRGRHGHDVKLSLNSLEPIFIEDKKMFKLTINSQEFEITSQTTFNAISAHIKELTDKNKALETTNSELTTSLERSKENLREERKDRDTLEARYDQLKADNKKMTENAKPKNDEIKTLVNERVKILKVAETLNSKVEESKQVKLDEMENSELKKFCISTLNSDVDLKDKNGAYIDARFDIITENIETQKEVDDDNNRTFEFDNLNNQKETTTTTNNTKVPAWREPLAMSK